MTEQWRLRPPDAVSGDDDVVWTNVRDTINPFANKAEVVLDDPDGDKRLEYPRPTLVELDVRVPGIFDWARRFAGFVFGTDHDRNETTLEILSHDFWLRKRDVSASYTDETLSAILEDVITRFSPLIWDSDLVELENDPVISREWNDRRADLVVEEVLSISGGDELYGATFDREFFVRSLGSESASRSFTPDEYVSTDWEIDDKDVVNRVSVRYLEGGEEERVVTEQSLGSQRDIQAALGSDTRVGLDASKNRLDIESEDRAKDVAASILEQRRELNSGTIETWDGFAIRPGQVVPVVDPDQDIDDDFRVVQIEYAWPGEPTELVVADRQRDASDELIELTDEVQRLDLQQTDADAPRLEVLRETFDAEIEATATVVAREFGDERFSLGLGRDELGLGREPLGIDLDDVTQAATDSARVTNVGLNAVRDGWRGEGNPTINTVAVGSGGSAPSRSDTALEELIEAFAATATLASMCCVRFSTTTRFSSTETIREIGIENGAGLLSRVTVDAIEVAPQAPVDIQLRLDVSDGGSRGVLTDAGAMTARDIIADNDPAIPALVGFGSDGSDAETTQDSLLEQLLAVDIDSSTTRGTGRVDIAGRLDDEQLDGEDIAELGLLASDETALTRLAFGSDPILKSGFALEAVQQTRFENP